jgi:hypothetical protein
MVGRMRYLQLAYYDNTDPLRVECTANALPRYS